MHYTPKPNTVFVHLEDMIDFDDPVYKERKFMYLGGIGLVYQYTEEYRNCSVPLTHEEFRPIK